MKRIVSLILSVLMMFSLLSIVASAEVDIVTETKIMYDFETVQTGITSKNLRSNLSGYQTAQPKSGIQSYGFQTSNGLWNQVGIKVNKNYNFEGYGYVRLEIPTGLNITGDVGFYLWANSWDTSSYMSYGVELADGTTYFLPYFTREFQNKKWLQFSLMETYYSSADQTTTYTATVADFADDAANRIVAFYVLDGGTGDNSVNCTSYIDDVYYTTEVEYNTPKATYSVDAPASAWETVLDWEDESQMSYVGGNKGVNRAENYGTDSGTGSVWSLKISGSYDGLDQKTTIALPSGSLSGAKSVRAWMQQGYNGSSNSAYGVTVNGVDYWIYKGKSGGYTGWVYYVNETFYTDPSDKTSDSITITTENYNQIDCLIFHFYDNYNIHKIDDVQVKYTNVADDTSAPEIENTRADENGNVVLAAAPEIEGEKFIGWMDPQGVLYKAGETAVITEDTEFTAVTSILNIRTGAGVRWAESEHERGIRFEMNVSKDALDAVGSSKFTLGALILPYKDYDADITVETAQEYGAVNVVNTSVYGAAVNGTAYRYYAGVVDFEKYFGGSQEVLADLKLTVVPYITIKYADDSTQTFYTQPDATDNVRSVSQVARAALADTAFGYNEQQIAILNLYNQYSKETDVPAYRVDNADKI